jgi:hypothetical protein
MKKAEGDRPLLTAKIRAIACYDCIKIKTTGMGNYYDYF